MHQLFAERRSALILDFFAGSGTTLNAVNLLNYEDGGSRRCILVTNNEVSDSDAEALTEAGDTRNANVGKPWNLQSGYVAKNEV